MFGRLACLFGRHRWQQVPNPELSAATPSLACARCGKDKPEYGPPGPGQSTGLNAGGM